MHKAHVIPMPRSVYPSLTNFNIARIHSNFDNHKSFIHRHKHIAFAFSLSLSCILFSIPLSIALQKSWHAIIGARSVLLGDRERERVGYELHLSGVITADYMTIVCNSLGTSNEHAPCKNRVNVIVT